ncbi:hypothetical protein D3C76_1665450 [compost metagenome]
MAADGDGALREHFHRFAKPTAAFYFDHVGPGAHHLGRALAGKLRRGVTHERQVGQQQAGWCPTAYRAGMVSHVGHGYRQR